MYEDFGYVATTGASLGVGILLLVVVGYLLAFGLSIAMYILQSLGFYTIADRRGIKHAWLSWLPVGNVWILGSIADQYRYVAKGQIRNRRKALLGLQIATAVLAVGMLGCYIYFIANFFINLPGLDFMPQQQQLDLLFAPLLVLLGICLVVEILAVIAVVIQYIALHDLYASCNPRHRVAFTVLSILLPVTMPFFIFACRKKDYGMPPRKDARIPVTPELIDEAPFVEE